MRRARCRTSVDCRSTSCEATLEWPSAGTAKESLHAITTAMYELPCGTGLRLPEQSDPGSRYRASVVFDCSEVRAKD